MMCLSAIVLLRDAALRRSTFVALIAGVVARAPHDLFRFVFLWAGWMPHDPIPHIGVALHLRPVWLAGYTWRYHGLRTVTP